MSARRLLLGLTGLSIGGGIASVSRTLVRALDEETRAGHIDRVDRVVLHDERRGADPARGSQFLAHGSQPRFAVRLWLERLRRRPDLLVFDIVGLARSLQLPLPAPRVPYVVFCHGIELTRASAGSSHHRALLGAARVIANSQTTARYVREEFPEVADRVHTALLCIDPDLVERWGRAGLTAGSRADLEARRRAEPVVLIISRIWADERGKGHDELLEAWPRILESVPAARFWIVGDGDDRERLEAKARDLGIADAVRFLGRVSDDELAECYQRASLFAMPSRQEGFGLVYAEAMWHGVPCLASRDDAGAEVVRDGATGVLVPYGDVEAIGDQIVSLLGDPERLARLGEAARAEARERFGYARFKRDLLAALGLESTT